MSCITSIGYDESSSEEENSIEEETSSDEENSSEEENSSDEGIDLDEFVSSNMISCIETLAGILSSTSDENNSDDIISCLPAVAGILAGHYALKNLSITPSDATTIRQKLETLEGFVESVTSAVVARKKRDDSYSIRIAMAEIHKLPEVVNNAEFYVRCLDLMPFKSVREVLCSIRDNERKLSFLRYMAYEGTTNDLHK